MRTVRSFIAHRKDEDGRVLESRRFRAGETVPKEWWEFISAQTLVDSPLPHLVEAAKEAGDDPPELDPYPEFRQFREMDQITMWVFEKGDGRERLKRARFALEAETGRKGKNRLLLVQQLRDLVDAGQSALNRMTVGDLELSETA